MADDAVAVLVSLLAPDGAPESVLIAPAVSEYLARWASDGEPGEPRVLRADAVPRALGRLERARVLTYDPAAVARQIRMSPRTQRDILDAAAPELVTAAIRAAADGLMQVRPGTHASGNAWGSWRSNVRCLTLRRPPVLWQPQGHPVLFVLGGSLVEVGLVDEARAYWRALLADAERYLGPQSPQAVAARAILATPLRPDEHLTAILQAFG
jgi:hypothetical protein